MDGIFQKDVEELCRVCLKASYFKMKSIFETKNANIIQEIEFCTGLTFKLEVGRPAKMCSGCLHSLSIAHEFKTACIKSEEILRECVSSVKVEENDDSEDDLISPNDEEIKGEPTDLNRMDLGKVCDNINDEVWNSSPENTDKCILQNVKNSKRGMELYNNTGITKPRRLQKLKYKRLYCESCDVRFKNKEESNAHKEQFHNEKSAWICEMCGKQFVHRTSLHSHVRTHQSPEYACDHCGYSTNIKADLVKHMRIHYGIKKYKCSLCASAAFKTVSNLRQHVRRVHEHERNFACPRDACGKTFSEKSKLMRHIDSHDNIRRHVCTVCESAYMRRSYWKRHLKKQHNIVVPKARPGRQKTYPT